MSCLVKYTLQLILHWQVKLRGKERKTAADWFRGKKAEIKTAVKVRDTLQYEHTLLEDVSRGREYSPIPIKIDLPPLLVPEKDAEFQTRIEALIDLLGVTLPGDFTYLTTSIPGYGIALRSHQERSAHTIFTPCGCDGSRCDGLKNDKKGEDDVDTQPRRRQWAQIVQNYGRVLNHTDSLSGSSSKQYMGLKRSDDLVTNGVPMCSWDSSFRRGKLQGLLKAETDVLIECNFLCKCNLRSCSNRSLQRGITKGLEVFWTGARGWGVRATEDITIGSFVCEYVGEVLTEDEASHRVVDSYHLQHDLPSIKKRWRGWMSSHAQRREDSTGSRKRKPRELPCSVDNAAGRRLGQAEQTDVVIDAHLYGNVSRFINHSCDGGNLTMMNVLVDTWDLRSVRMGLFASSNIKKGDELLYDYSCSEPSISRMRPNSKCCVALDNDTPQSISNRLQVAVSDFICLNKETFAGLHKKSRFYEGTVLSVPQKTAAGAAASNGKARAGPNTARENSKISKATTHPRASMFSHACLCGSRFCRNISFKK